jgi:phosphate ABC transporter phosphate-binding protein
MSLRKKSGSPLRALEMSILLFGMLVFNFSRLLPEASEHLYAIHNVFVAPGATDTSSQTVRSEVLKRIKKTKTLRLVSSETSADAVLFINAMIWPSGREMLNPRNRHVTVTGIQGYASGELVDRSKQPLWSYLVTPSRFHFASTAADLGDQLSANLILAVEEGFQAIPKATTPAADVSLRLRVAGATFPTPLYEKWFESFRHVANGFPVTYDAVGSADGIDQLRKGSVDIAASDIDVISEAGFSPVKVHLFPTVVGGVVPIYNLPGLKQMILNLSPDVLAQIYSGDIVRWSDPRIRSLNHNAHLPDSAIKVIHRSDGSGTTYLWTRFLSEAGTNWKSQVGAGIQWPVGVGVAGSQGMVERVSHNPESIGYVELTYAIQNQVSYAAVQNRSGQFIKADLSSISAAAIANPGTISGVPTSILNSTRPEAYPIASFTWFLVPDVLDAAKRRAIYALLRWTLTSGQRQCSSLAYAPLPKELLREELKQIDSLK